MLCLKILFIVQRRLGRSIRRSQSIISKTLINLLKWQSLEGLRSLVVEFVRLLSETLMSILSRKSIRRLEMNSNLWQKRMITNTLSLF